MSNEHTDRIIGRDVVPGKPDLVRVLFASDCSVDIPIALWVQQGLKVGADITSGDLSFLTRAERAAEAREAALRYLNYKSRTEHEVRTYLLRLKYTDEMAQQVIDELIDARHIDDLLYARMYADSKRSVLSHKEVEWKLRQRGVALEVIRRVLANDEAHQGESEAATAIARKYWHRHRAVPAQKRKMKLAAYLQRKGYPLDLIQRVIEALFSGDMENEYS